MGTRNLTIVKDKNNVLKVAQYGQWDGYPSGQGVTILEFAKKIRSMFLLQKKLESIKFWNDVDDINEYIEDYDKKAPEMSNQSDNRTDKDIYWWYMLQSRDLGGEILNSIIKINLDNLPNEHNKTIYLKNSIDFAKDSLFCEYAYCINFYTNKFQIFKGFNTKKENEYKDFSTTNEEVEKNYEGIETKYFGLSLMKEYNLDILPTKKVFLKEMDDLEGENK